jgi:hypothetical protein
VRRWPTAQPPCLESQGVCVSRISSKIRPARVTLPAAALPPAWLSRSRRQASLHTR